MRGLDPRIHHASKLFRAKNGLLRSGSLPPALRLCVVSIVPFELADQLQQTLLLPARDEWGASGEIAFQTLKCHPRSAALPAASRQVSVLDILDMALDRLARLITLAASGLFGERIEALRDLRGKTKRKHGWAPVAIHV
jgi:hypothetical protein